MKLMVLFMALLAVGMVSATDSLCPAGEVLDQQDITGTMSFSLVKNSGGGNMHPRVYADGTNEVYFDNSPFLLVDDGRRVIDNRFTPNVLGVAIKRTDSGIWVHFQGSNEEGKETATAILTLSGATFGSFSNAKSNHNDMERPRDGRGEPGKPGQDEVTYLSADTIWIVSTTATGNDRFFIEVLPSCHEVPLCSDGFDNDGDWAVDLQDFGCTSLTDNDETNRGTTQCSAGRDNDGDGLIDQADPGCTGPADDDERTLPPTPACRDGRDNDNDGLIDHPLDPGCLDANDPDETDPAVPPQCFDGADNDGDNLIDYPNDPGCMSASDNDEADARPQCSDRADNDNDGKTDFPADPGCADASDNDETDPAPPQCSDTFDNDGDRSTDFPADFGCESSSDTNETNDGNTQCSDGVDNDNDGRIDQADSDCDSRTDDTEGPIACTSDADCPNGFVDGRSCRLDNVMQSMMRSTCENPGTTQSSCQTTFRERVIVEHCDERCSEGACVDRARETQIFSDDLYLPAINIGRYNPGDRQIPITIRMENRGDLDLDGVRVVATIPELSVFQPLGRVDIADGKTVTVRGAVDLPMDIAPGEYTLGVFVGNEDAHRRVYRAFRIQ